MLAWELVGAVIGAGFASGREIASFFAQYGGWSAVGIPAAVLSMVWLSTAKLPPRWRGCLAEKLWKGLLSLLLIATGGAMLSGAGEVIALALPVRGAYWLGLIGTLLLAWLLAARTIRGLAWVSCILLCILTALIALGLTRPPMQAVVLTDPNPIQAVLRGVTYGGFNAALQTPILAHTPCKGKVRKRAILRAAGIISLLLMLGDAVLLRHPALMGEPLPFIRLMNGLGKAGYLLGASCLYLAILSTMTACLRGLGSAAWAIGMTFLVALMGFSGMVETVYPLLGGACVLMLAAAKFTN